MVVIAFVGDVAALVSRQTDPNQHAAFGDLSAFQHAACSRRLVSTLRLRLRLSALQLMSSVRLVPGRALRDGFRAEALTSAGQRGVTPSLLTC